MFVFIGIAQADEFAGRGLQTAGALDLQEEQFYRIFGVAQNRCFAVEGAAVNLGAGVVGNEATAFDKAAFDGAAASGNREVGQIGGVRAVGGDGTFVVAGGLHAHGAAAVAVGCGQIDADEVTRNAVNRETGFAGLAGVAF